jgi:hypothetical protein
VEYFLFDLKQGYCDYFASAMVVLLRAQGIPARLATGYVAGKFDNNTRKFVVTEEEAHSWPEVYFPGYGWMAFEPSGYRPPIVRPEESSASALTGSEDCYEYNDYGECLDYGELSDLGILLPGDQAAAPVIGVYQSGPGFNWRAFVLPLLLFLGLGAAGYWLFTNWEFGSHRHSTRDVVRRTYQRMSTYGALFGIRRKPSQTPLEYAQTLTDGLRRTLADDGPAARFGLRDLVGPPNGAAEAIASSYVRSQYSQQDLSELDRERVLEGWRELRRQLPVLLLRDRRN